MISGERGEREEKEERREWCDTAHALSSRDLIAIKPYRSVARSVRGYREIL